ncbi:MAG: pilus assembly protein PilM [Myxococcota bacterium]|jgi:type IV pilus assembly protein PilM|nr:pilus assembly protein PilM [Myxococcota bacterium]
MAQTVIGLDLGTWSIKAAVLESTIRGFSLVEVAEHHLPRGADGAVLDDDRTSSIRALLREIRPPEIVATAIPGRRAMTREVTLPFSDDKKIATVLGFELEELLPLDIDELVYDYESLDSSAEGANLLCAAVDRAWFSEFLAELQAADIDPKVVTLDAMAYAHLHASLGEEDAAQGCVALVDVGHETTSITVLDAGKIRTVRTLARGGHHLTTALMQGLDVDYARAETIKHGRLRVDGHLPSEVPGAEHAQYVELIRKPLDACVRDIRLTLHAHTNRWRTQVDRVILFGGGSRLPGFDAELSHALGLKVESPRLSTQGWTKMVLPQEQERSMTMAAALGLGFVRGMRDGINFRQGEFASESDFKALRERAGWLLTLAALLLATFFARQVVSLRMLEANHEVLVSQLEKFSKSVLGEEKDDFDFVLQRLNKPPEQEADSVFPELTAFRTFFELTDSQALVNEMKQAAEGVAPGPPGVSPPVLRAPGRGASKDEKQRYIESRKADKDRRMERMKRDYLEAPAIKRADRSRLLPGTAPPALPRVIRPPDKPSKGTRPDKPDAERPESPEPDKPGEEAGEEEVEDGRYRVELKQVQIDLKGAFIKGEANNIEAIEAFTSELKKHRCFETVETSDTTRLSFGDRQDWLRFQLKIGIDCSAKAEAAEEKKKNEEESR